MASINGTGQSATPYGSSWWQYGRAGWSAFPLPFGKKEPPLVPGSTGAGAVFFDVWVARELAGTDLAAGNVGLRMPRGVVGIDVDNYGEKHGAASLNALISECGPLPAGWLSTSRHPAEGGTVFFRVPRGMLSPGMLGDGIDMILPHDRYSLVWPSVHPSGEVVRWHRVIRQISKWNKINTVEVAAGEVPWAWELPELPAAWVEKLDRLGGGDGDPWGRPAAGEQVVRSVAERPVSGPGWSEAETEEWLAGLPGGPACDMLMSRLDHYVARLVEVGENGRHYVARDATFNLAALHYAGHRGLVTALEGLYDAWLGVLGVAHGSTRAREFWRAAGGAAAKLERERAGGDPCQVADGLMEYLGGGEKIEAEAPEDAAVPDLVTPTKAEVPPAEAVSTGGPPEPPKVKAAPAAEPPDDDGEQRLRRLVFGASERLEHCLAYAQAYQMSPWALLGCCLLRVVACTEPWVVLEAAVGSDSYGSLNMAVPVVGGPGAGKRVASRGAINMLGPGACVDRFELGSGEGMISPTFIEYKAVMGGGFEWFWTRARALLTTDEIDKLAALASRQGHTGMSLMKSMWDGSAVGMANTTGERRRFLPGHGYRACWELGGVQPVNAEVLLKSDDGFAQRLLWVDALDPLAVNPAQGLPDAPGPFPGGGWKLPDEIVSHKGGGLLVDDLGMGKEVRSGKASWDKLIEPFVITMPADARLAMQMHRYDVSRGKVPQDEVHSLQARAKVAAALALYEGRVAVTLWDWQVAEAIMAHSFATIRKVRQGLAKVNQQKQEARGRAQAMADMAAGSYRLSGVDKVAGRLLEILGELGGECTKKDINGKLTKGHREFYDEAMVQLIKDGYVEEVVGTGRRFRLVPESS